MGWIFFILTIVVALALALVYRGRTLRSRSELEEKHRGRIRDVRRESDARVSRIERESEARAERAGLVLVADLLPALDALRQADRGETPVDPAELLEGIRLVIREVDSALGRHGVVPIEPAPGEEFNPTYHEAVELVEVEESGASGKIAACHRVGYRKDEYVLRNALVAVAREKMEEVSEPSETPAAYAQVSENR